MKCIECDADFNPKRHKLGYNTCLECGDKKAAEQTRRKSMCTAPAYNKGAYMYVSSSSMARDLGK